MKSYFDNWWEKAGCCLFPMNIIRQCLRRAFDAGYQEGVEDRKAIRDTIADLVQQVESLYKFKRGILQAYGYTDEGFMKTLHGGHIVRLIVIDQKKIERLEQEKADLTKQVNELRAVVLEAETESEL